MGISWEGIRGEIGRVDNGEVLTFVGVEVWLQIF